MGINENKEVIIKVNDVDLFKNTPNIVLYVSDFNISYSNEYTEPMQDIMNTFKNSIVGKIASAVGNIADAKAGASAGLSLSSEDFNFKQPNSRAISKYSKIKAWKGTSNIKFSLKFEFNYGKYGLYDAGLEVISPIETLVNLAAPESFKIDGDNYGVRGPMPTSSWYWGMIFATGAETIRNSAEGIIATQTNANAASVLNDGGENYTVYEKKLQAQKSAQAAFDSSSSPENQQALTAATNELNNAQVALKSRSAKIEQNFLNTLSKWESTIVDGIDKGFKNTKVSGNGSKALTHIKIGKIFSCVATAMGASYTLDMTNVDSKGLPMKGTVTLEFESVGMLTQSELEVVN